MYRVSIPVNCDKFHRARDKGAIVRELRAFDASRVMLNFETSLDGHVLLADRAASERQLARMAEACRFFRDEGFEVGAWFWGLQFDASLGFERIRTVTGKTTPHFACPTDEHFLDAFSARLREIAETGVELILLNDDLRFGAYGGFGCLCKNHVNIICRALGETLSAEELAERITVGGKNRYRDAFLAANRASLENYARRMRAAIDEVDPSIRLGFCACISSWDIDGDAFDLARLLAGKTRPLLRLIGAPYWTGGQGLESRLGAIVELERMQASWRDDPEIELIAEGDVYPRPRIACPASYLEGFDTALRASGALDGILRISVDYVSNVGYERGYLDHYRKNKPLYRAIEQHFSDKRAVGVRIYESKRKVATIENPNALGKKSDFEELFFSPAARMLTASAIPTVYEGLGVTGVAFGENARALSDESLARGLILDAHAASILSGSGVDVGVESFGGAVPFDFAYFPEEETFVIAGRCAAFELSLRRGAEPLAFTARSTEAPSQTPLCYRYRNAKGERFLVLNVIARDAEMLLRHSAVARIVSESVKWLSGDPLPAFCPGHPYLYLQCKESESETVLGIWNFFADAALAPVVELGSTYRAVEFPCGGGRLASDRLFLEDIAPYGFAAVVLKK